MATPEPVASLEEAVDTETARRIMEDTPQRLFGL